MAQWTILEAVPNPIEGCTAHFIRGIFDANYKIPFGFDAVVHTHTMEHFYSPLETIKNISNSMTIGSYMFFSIPNLEEMFKRYYTNVMNFEHTYFCAEPYVSVILNEAGYKVLERRLFKDEHSVFYVTQKIRTDRQTPNVKILNDHYLCNKNLLCNWKIYHEDLADRINVTLSQVCETRRIYLFGAHVYAQFLLAFGVNRERIVAVLDNDKSKQGKRLYGTPYTVFSPSILKDEISPVVILHAGTHDSEIKGGILGINSATDFV